MSQFLGIISKLEKNLQQKKQLQESTQAQDMVRATIQEFQRSCCQPSNRQQPETTSDALTICKR